MFNDFSSLADFTTPIDNNVFRVMKRALPGPYTFILKANHNVPKIFHNKKKSIGVRIPDHNVPREIVRMLGNPIVTTSIHDEDKKDEYTSDTVTRVCSHVLISNLRSYIREVLYMMGQDVNSFPLYSFFDPKLRIQFNNKKE